MYQTVCTICYANYREISSESLNRKKCGICNENLVNITHLCNHCDASIAKLRQCELCMEQVCETCYHNTEIKYPIIQTILRLNLCITCKCDQKLQQKSLPLLITNRPTSIVKLHDFKRASNQLAITQMKTLLLISKVKNNIVINKYINKYLILNYILPFLVYNYVNDNTLIVEYYIDDDIPYKYERCSSCFLYTDTLYSFCEVCDDDNMNYKICTTCQWEKYENYACERCTDACCRIHMDENKICCNYKEIHYNKSYFACL